MDITQTKTEDELIKETEIKLQHKEEEIIQEQDTFKPLILEEISKYSPHSQVLTLSTLLAISQGVHICNISPPGQGKSRNTVELLKLLRIPFSLIAGHTTPRQFFSELEKDGIIIVDEGATILSDNNIINLLLNALWNGKVEWKNNKEIKSHTFKGVIIFNVNKLSNTGLTEALKDRIFVNEVNLSSNEIKDKIMASRTYKPNMEIWAEIRERLELDIVSQNMTSKSQSKIGILMSKKLKNSTNPRNLEDFDIIFEKVYHLIENGEDIKSVREIKKLKELALFSYILVGDLSLIDYFRKTDEIWKILNAPIKKSEKVKLIAEAKCITERHAYRIIDKFENEKEGNIA
jgi:hypothetical protein